LVDRRPRAIARWPSVDMVFVEHESKDTRARPTRGAFLIGLSSNFLAGAGVFGERAQLDRLDWPRDTVLQQLEIRWLEIQDRPALRVGHHRVDSNRRRIVGSRSR